MLLFFYNSVGLHKFLLEEEAIAALDVKKAKEREDVALELVAKTSCDYGAIKLQELKEQIISLLLYCQSLVQKRSTSTKNCIRIAAAYALSPEPPSFDAV